MSKLRKWAALAAALVCLGASSALAEGDTLRVGVNIDAKNLDPQNSVDTASFSLIKQIYEPLYTVDGKTRQLVPVLAESYEMLDQRTYKFYLKKGVKFHNGEEMTADDVVFSLKRSTGPDSVYAGSSGSYIDPEGFEIIDRYTVIVRTKGPVGGFLVGMKHPYASIFSRKALEEYGDDYFRNPVGTGPFKFKRWLKGERLELEAFEDYHGEKPAFKNMIFYVIPDDSSRVIALETGNLDFIYAVPSSDADRLSQRDDVFVTKGPSMVLMHLGMNCKSPKLADPRVRLAIEYAIDKEILNAVVYQGNSEVPQGPLLPVSIFYPDSPKGFPYDQEKAKALLAEAGVSQLDLELWVVNAQDRIDLATVIQSMLAQVGITVHIQVLETGLFDDRTRRGEHDMYITTWGMQTTRDPRTYWMTLCHSSGAGTTNKTFVDDALLDQYIEEAMAAMDDQRRDEAFQKIWDRINEVHPLVPLALPNELYGARKGLQGVEDLYDGKINYLGNLHY